MNNTTIWQTFEGNRISLDEMDHQHLCNIYYFIKYEIAGIYDSRIIQLIKDTLAKRFDDILLPYRPLRRFKQEIDFLQRKGWLWPKPSGIGHNVVINGEWVGEVDESMF